MGGQARQRIIDAFSIRRMTGKLEEVYRQAAGTPSATPSFHQQRRSMTIRPTTPADRPAIIDLLQRSMGETSTRKSETYWQWKHEENPFGPSPVLVAETDGRLVGVRAFMRWAWSQGNDTLSALRAVDTATDPDYRGQGIFKKLTLQLVEDCRREGDHFIFQHAQRKKRSRLPENGVAEAGPVAGQFAAGPAPAIGNVPGRDFQKRRWPCTGNFPGRLGDSTQPFQTGRPVGTPPAPPNTSTGGTPAVRWLATPPTARRVGF